MARKVIIVGGVAGGASAAARLRRLDEKAEIILVEQGEYVSFANCGLPYYIGGAIKKRNALLVQTPKALKRRFNIDVRTSSRVESIQPDKKSVKIHNIATGEVYDEPYDQLILSPGAQPIIPAIPGIEHPRVFTLRNIPDVDIVKAYITDHHPSRALVAGGGFIGIEMAENLMGAGVKATVVEMSSQILPPLDLEMAAIVHHELHENGVDLRLNVGLASVREASSGSLICGFTDGSECEVDFVVLSVGVKADSGLAVRAGLALGPKGTIAVDGHMRTSQPDIYAVGDAISYNDFVLGIPSMIPLAGPANRQGRLAADNIAGRIGQYAGTQGTSIVKVFRLAAGATGANEKQLKGANRKYSKVYVHPSSHATYYPGFETISIKLLFDSDTGKVLGAQAVGRDGVGKCIDVFATAIRAGMTVYDLEQLELSYAPPFSSAKDPVNMAGFTAANVLRGAFQQIFIEDLADIDENTDYLIDVRTPNEYLEGTIGNAKNFELDELREHLSEIPRNKKLIVFCRAGLRGYIACRILQQSGFKNVYNLSGGYLTWHPVFG